MQAAIVDNRIAGTRITVWDVVHYLENRRSPEEIAGILSLSVEQVQAAVRYIEEHQDEVMRVHRQIEERIARGNPPEVEAKAHASHAKLMAEIERRRRIKDAERNGAWPSGGP